ncbi:MAG: RNase H family protein [Nostocales cyanobacterium 94392]|nr:RNase H family protein [Nostocales cyanobacterium 94392]
MTELKEIIIYTRGVSSITGTGGYGVVLLYNGRRKELSGKLENSSNNKMDIIASIEGLKALKFPCKVTIYNNNTYLIDAMNKGWVESWEVKGWKNSEKKPTPHVELWKQLKEMCAIHEVSFVYIKADFQNQDYKCCDNLAQLAVR